MVVGPGSYLCCLQILQHEVPELGRRVQQQELEASRSDTGRLSRFSARNGGADGNGMQGGAAYFLYLLRPLSSSLRALDTRFI